MLDLATILILCFKSNILFFFANAFNKTNIISWSFIKYKRVIKSILVLEFSAMVQEFDIGVVIKLIIKEIFDIKPLLKRSNNRYMWFIAKS